MKLKYRYFIVTNSNQPIMFNQYGRGQWMNKKGEKIDSDYSLSYFLDKAKDWKTLEVNRREFFRFAKSQYNKTF